MDAKGGSFDTEEVDETALHHEQELEGTRVNAAEAMRNDYRHNLDQELVLATWKIRPAYRRHLERNNVVRKGIGESQTRSLLART